MPDTKNAKQKIDYIALDSRVLAVAKEGAIGDWAAYIGAVLGKNHEREAEEVAGRGSKLPKKVAELLFPNWASKDWRD